MNILVLSYTDSLGQKYLCSYLEEIITENNNTCTVLDVSMCEYHVLNEKINANPNDYHNYLRITNSSVSSLVTNIIYRAVTSNSIDLIICLNSALTEYIEMLFEEKNVNLHVLFFVFDSNSLRGDNKFIDKYLLVSSQDMQKMCTKGIPTEKITFTGLPGNRFKLSKADARKELMMYLEGPVCTLLTDDYDEVNLYKIIDSFIVSAVSEVNLLIICKDSYYLCRKINSKYKRHSNIAAVFAFESIITHIAATDILIANSNLNDVMLGLLNDKPVITVNNRIKDKDMLKYLKDNMYALFANSDKEVIELLESVIYNRVFRENLSNYRKEIVIPDSDSIILEEIKKTIT